MCTAVFRAKLNKQCFVAIKFKKKFTFTFLAADIELLIKHELRPAGLISCPSKNSKKGTRDVAVKYYVLYVVYTADNISAVQTFKENNFLVSAVFFGVF